MIQTRIPHRPVQHPETGEWVPPRFYVARDGFNRHYATREEAERDFEAGQADLDQAFGHFGKYQKTEAQGQAPYPLREARYRNVRKDGQLGAYRNSIQLCEIPGQEVQDV